MVLDPVSLSSLTFSIVGPGRVGTSMAHWLTARGGRLRQVGTRRPESYRGLDKELGAEVVAGSEITTATDDLCLISVSDDALQSVAAVLSERPQAKVVLHTCGRATAEVLGPLRQGGSAVGSLHPLMAFAEIHRDPGQARAIVFGIDGDAAALAMARRIAAALSATTSVIPPAARSSYHLAATMSAGALITLLASAAELAEKMGLDRVVVDGYLSLAQGALERAVSTKTIAEAITGPIARGDDAGFARQIDEVRRLDPELADLLEALARRTRHHCRRSDPDAG